MTQKRKKFNAILFKLGIELVITSCLGCAAPQVLMAASPNSAGQVFSEAVEVVTFAAVPNIKAVTMVSDEVALVIIDPNGNPPATEFAIHETVTDKWVDPQSQTLVSKPVFTTFAGWGADRGLAIRVGDIANPAFSVTAKNVAGEFTKPSGTVSASGWLRLSNTSRETLIEGAILFAGAVVFLGLAIYEWRILHRKKPPKRKLRKRKRKK